VPLVFLVVGVAGVVVALAALAAGDDALLLVGVDLLFLLVSFLDCSPFGGEGGRVAAFLLRAVEAGVLGGMV
jgi:hypothetical protein